MKTSEDRMDEMDCRQPWMAVGPQRFGAASSGAHGDTIVRALASVLLIGLTVGALEVVAKEPESAARRVSESASVLKGFPNRLFLISAKPKAVNAEKYDALLKAALTRLTEEGFLVEIGNAADYHKHVLAAEAAAKADDPSASVRRHEALQIELNLVSQMPAGEAYSISAFYTAVGVPGEVWLPALDGPLNVVESNGESQVALGKARRQRIAWLYRTPGVLGVVPGWKAVSDQTLQQLEHFTRDWQAANAK